MFQPFEREFDNAPLGGVFRMDAERCAHVRETMADLTRPRAEQTPYAIADEVTADRIVWSSQPRWRALSAARRATLDKNCVQVGIPCGRGRPGIAGCV